SWASGTSSTVTAGYGASPVTGRSTRQVASGLASCIPSAMSWMVIVNAPTGTGSGSAITCLSGVGASPTTTLNGVAATTASGHSRRAYEVRDPPWSSSPVDAATAPPAPAAPGMVHCPVMLGSTPVVGCGAPGPAPAPDPPAPAPTGGGVVGA